MAFEPGGYADKLGNRYEGRWVARQLLLLLNEQIRSVTLESVGDDEAGVDLWIDRLDGNREAQQCKAENGTKSHWTLNDLKSRGVLGHLRTQLQRDPRHRFTFVSSSPAPQLRDLSRSAMDSTGDAESFYADQIQAGSRDRQAGFSDWCNVFGLNELNSDDRAMAFDLLRRSGFHQFSDTGEERESLKWMAKQAAIGDADTVLALLADFAADNLRKTIIAADVCQHLLKSGYNPRRLFADERIGPRLDELRADFDDSICPHLAGGKLIARPEVDEILALLDDEAHTDAIILHGTAGHGKSGVLYQLTLKLHERGTPFLALRLDRKVPAGSPRQFGLELGLPESPVNCLDAVSSAHTSVLILDQLDALRWTSSHATEGLEVCKGLLREVRAMRMVGRRISIVVCCRTFDLEHDPQIRTWLKPSKDLAVKKVAVAELPEARVREFVESLNVNFARMTPRRQSLLRSVQNLAIWAEVVQSETGSPEFDSGTDLMRAFWSNRRKEIEKAGFAASERDALLDRLIDHMESRATLSAPRRLIERHEGLATELQTLNVIHVERHSVSFCHQSYLDFLIANRVLAQLASGSEAIVDWLGNRSQQSLFRREQLRQLLFLIAEEKPLELSSTLDMLLASDAVRFHIKQLAIEAVGQLRPSPALIAHVITMSESERWRDHVIRDVVHGSVNWMNAFHESGRLFDWLLSSDVSNQNTAVWLMNSVAETMPSLIEAALAATKEAGITERLRGALLFSKASEEADAVFEFRLSNLGNEAEPPYISWKEVADRRPDRAIHLLATLLKQPQKNRVTNRYGRRLALDGSNDIKALMNAANRCPRLTVRVLVPVLSAIAKRKLQERLDWNNRATSDTYVEYPHTKYPKVLLTIVRAAVVSLARSTPDLFVQLSKDLGSIPSRSVRSILARGWSAMTEKYADAAINWLVFDQRRLRCGSQRRKPRWCAAARLIEKMSPHCSADVFARLENTLLKYRDPDEKRLASYWLQETRDGYYRNQFGAAQRFLLPALVPSRRSIETTGRIGVLERKFTNYPIECFLGVHPSGGWVRSPLNQDTVSRISDKQWLRLIANERIRSRDSHSRQSTYLRDAVIESSIEMFAHDFGLAAKREPTRFAKLALEIPIDAPPEYIAELFSALQHTKPPNEVPENQRASWQPASRESVEDVLESVPLHNDSNSMRSFCWLVRYRDDIRPTPRVVDQLIELSSHSHPEADELVVGCDKTASEVGVHELENNAINCVRSLAAIAIGSILYEHREMFPRFRSSLERLLYDPHPAVRVAMVEVCLPVWNIDRPLAVKWFLELVSDDLRPACSRHAQRLCNCAFPEFAEQLSPLIQLMCDSPVPEIAEEGAQEATARWLFFDLFHELVTKCRTGSEPQRKGVAAIVGRFVRDEKYASKCWKILLELCNDPSIEVRSQASRGLHDERILSTPDNVERLTAFLTTEAFDDDPDSLLDALQDHTGSLLPFAPLIFDTVSRSIEIIRDPKDKPDRRFSLIDRHLTTVLLRLYEQAEGDSRREIRDRCLDMFDELLEHRIAPARSLIEEIQR